MGARRSLCRGTTQGLLIYMNQYNTIHTPGGKKCLRCGHPLNFELYRVAGRCSNVKCSENKEYNTPQKGDLK